MNSLIKEINNHIFDIINNQDISDLYIKDISIEFDDGTISPIKLIGGSTRMGSELIVIFLDLTDGLNKDYIILARYNENEFVLTQEKFFVVGDKLKNGTITQLASLLIIFEKLNDFGLSFEKKDITNLVEKFENFLGELL